MRNMLIIGNGFDRALNMPTAYNDFLKFYDKAKSLYNKFCEKDILAEALPEKYHDLTADSLANNKNVIYKDLFWSGIDACYRATLDSCCEMFCELLGKFEASSSDYEKMFIGKGFREINAKLIWMLARSNFWMEYFKKTKKKQGWIDFEKTIGNLLKELTKEKCDPICIDLFQCWNLNPSDEVVGEFLADQLDQLKDFLEGYLIIFERARHWVQEMQSYSGNATYFITCDVNRLENLIGSDIDYVVSLNYTDTYNSVFHGEGNVEYVHGRVRNPDDKNEDFTTVAGLVFGINDQADLERYRWVFKKNQIEQYGIDVKYLDYLRQNKDIIDSIIIYGCSLGEADIEIFEPIFLEFVDIKKKIYCYDCQGKNNLQIAVRNIIRDENRYEEQIKNGNIDYYVVNEK